ncbi:hypothetical protein [Cryptosporangium minutisporangium]|uniref:Uncharacterized protein n=1 Tax=Cryptosporangium minutisporangium TaxID=113569 RepID=A0ABP6T1W7_9ACTN
MSTRTGDATADLLALLTAHCPDVAEETLARLATAAVAVGEAAGGGGSGDGGADPGAEPDGGSVPLRWSQLTLGQIPGLAEVVSAAQVPVQVVAALLELAAGILEVVSKLLISLPDPIRALILAAIELITTIIDDLLRSGAYVYVDAPGLLSNVVTVRELGGSEPDMPQWLAGDKPLRPNRPADGFAQWAHRFRQSFDDPGDHDRPTFSDGAPVEALFIVATAPNLPDLAALGPLLASLFDAKAFGKAWEHFAATYPTWPDDPDRSRLRAHSVRPDWRSWELRDLGGDAGYPLRLLEKIPVWLEALLLNVDGVVALIKALVEAVRLKIDVLRQIVTILQQVIDTLAALTATGLHCLFVATDEGVDGLVSAFLEATNRPNTAPDGSVTTANAVAGVCLLAGTAEIAPIWALLGQGKTAEQAFVGLTEDWNALSDQAERSAADAAALAGTAWKELETTSAGPTAELVALAGPLGRTAAEVAEAAGISRGDLVTGLEQLLDEGVRLDPATLAYVEATRRARRRGNRSLAMSLGTRPAPPGGRS